MPYKCRGKCDNEPKRKPNPDKPAQKRGEPGRYSNGYKRCTPCDKYIKSDKRRCYCCGVLLRTTSYKSKRKRRILETIARY